MGFGSVGRAIDRSSWNKWAVVFYRAALADGVVGCAAKHAASPTKLVVESTAIEVVAVSSDGASTAYGSCLEEAVWAVKLPAKFDHHATLRFTVDP